MNRKHIRLHYSKEDEASREKLLEGEWLVTNGIGGYASSSVIGITTRKYHALLVASLPPPYGRTIMLNHLTENILIGEQNYLLNCEETMDGSLNLQAVHYLHSFYLEDGLPVWVYELNGNIIEKRILMIHKQNTVYVFYRLLEGKENVILKLAPALHFRAHESPVNQPLNADNYTVMVAGGNMFEIKKKDLAPLRLAIFGEKGNFTVDGKYMRNVFFRVESWRGYESRGELWNPGYFQIELKKGHEAGILASTEDWATIHALLPDEVILAEEIRRRRLLILSTNAGYDKIASELILAADQFIITPESRIEDAARANATGDEIRTIIAGYHWFTDWGRDTMISLEGLTLCTGRIREASWILKTFSHYVKDGLIPNMFPEGQNEGLYHTADATMWYFHAIDRYFQRTRDTLTLELLLPKLFDIVHGHLKGTRFGIQMDAEDGLLKQGAEGYQLTWMDAKVGDWVVTPRRGKAVEINALWYNALKLMEEWMRLQNDHETARYFAELSLKTEESFNDKFWNMEKKCLFDVVEGGKGNDDSIRPNQLFAISLKYPILKREYWEPVVQKCKETLLTPYGLRTLSADHPEFKPHYAGDLLTRDSSYHQGTVWPWLLGPFIDAWLKTFPDDLAGAQHFLSHIEKTLREAGVGSIGEVFDAVEPHHPRGCIAQAWSIAEILRIWLKTHPKT